MKKGTALTALLFFVLTGLQLEGFSSFFSSHGEDPGIQLGSSSHPSGSDDGIAELLCEEREEQESRVRILPTLLPEINRTGYSFPAKHFVRREADCSLLDAFIVFPHLLRAPPIV